jgi:hypothetical protein
VAFVCARTRCGFDDAAWAICREDSPRPGHRLDTAIGKVREEGFQIPRASTEAQSFAALRRIIRASPRPVQRRPLRKPSGDAVARPRRVELPADSI